MMNNVDSFFSNLYTIPHANQFTTKSRNTTTNTHFATIYTYIKSTDFTHTSAQDMLPEFNKS